MRNKIWLCCLSTVLLLLMVAVWLLFAEAEPGTPFSVQCSADGGTEIILCHRAEDGSYYVFLPSFAELPSATIRLHTQQTVRIASKPLTDGMQCDEFDTDTAYEFDYGDIKSSITFCSATPMPTVCIDTETGNMEYVHAKKGNTEIVSVRLYGADGRASYISTDATLQGRGNYTWSAFEKKPYSLTLSQEASLLEMGAATRWVLLANAADVSHIRNKLAYDFAADIGLSYSPQSAWVELYLNGEYVGLYLLCERNEIHRERVNVVTDGSFLISAELESRLVQQGYPYLTTPSGQTMRLHSPKSASQENLQAYNDILRAVEGAILSADGTDPYSGKSLEELIDIDSWAKKYLVEEVFGNIDACLISQYYYYDAKTQKMFAGPVWDFDISLGSNANPDIKSPYVFVGSKLRASETSSTQWFEQLYQNELFYRRVTELYETLALPILEHLLDSRIESYDAEVSPARLRDELRWENVGASEQEAKYMKTYLSERLKLLTKVWMDGTKLCFLKIEQGLAAYYGVPFGQCADMLQEPKHPEGLNFLGWYNVATDEMFDASKPITEDISLYAKWEEKPAAKHKELLKLLPVTIMAVVFLGMLAIEGRNWKKRKGR